MIAIHVQDITNEFLTSTGIYAILEFDDNKQPPAHIVKGITLDLKTSLKLLVISNGRIVMDNLYMWRSNKLKRVIENL